MKITKMNEFLEYLEKTRDATNRVILAIPRDKMDWSYMPGKFSMGDLVRHIAAIERYVFAEVASGKTPSYTGCGKDLADGYDAILSYYNEMHRQSVEIFKSIPDERLPTEIKSLDGRTIELGNFLRALIVHEVHHRGALCLYLNLLGVESPPIIGLKEEQVIALSQAEKVNSVP